jgi:hypothetical protein
MMIYLNDFQLLASYIFYCITVVYQYISQEKLVDYLAFYFQDLLKKQVIIDPGQKSYGVHSQCLFIFIAIYKDEDCTLVNWKRK